MQRFKLSLVSLLSLAAIDSSLGQETRVVEVLPAKPLPAKHLGTGPIDLNNLSPDILNCDVCRKRLGLPPMSEARAPQIALAKPAEPTSKTPTLKTESLPEQTPVPMLGSPGLISSLTAEKMAQSGLVVEEFQPPQLKPNAIQLDGIPREVREQFLQGLQLPYGAKVMSAKVAESQAATSNDETASTQPPAAEATPPSTQTPSTVPPGVADSPSLGGPGIVPQPPQSPATPATTEQLSAPNKAADPQEASAVSIPPAPPKQEDFDAHRIAMEERLNRMQSEWQKRMAQADAANKEVLNMLEKRTAEVSELQAQLKSQQDALAKAAADLEAKNVELSHRKTESKDAKKKAPNKAKAPRKTAVET